MTVTEDLVSVGGIKALMFEGQTLRADIAGALTAADVELTIEGASTLTLTMRDSARKLLGSGMFGDRVTAQVPPHSFELVQVRKAGPDLVTTFEALEVAALRRHDEPRKVEAGRFTHVEFARLLVSEEPWIDFQSWPGIHAIKSRVELARGRPAGVSSTGEAEEEEREDTWTAIGRLADERGWRRFIKNGALHYVPETFLFLGEPEFVFEEGRNGVDEIDFDFDIGKEIATASAVVRAGRWKLPPGTVVEVRGCGPANGKWLVKSIRRSLFSLLITVELTKPRPTLPEPEPPPAPTAEELGAEGEPSAGNLELDYGNLRVDTGATSGAGYVWPCRGRISSAFGMRDGRLHAGIDIAAVTGTPVGATRAGTVTVAGWLDGYGNAVYIDHGGVISRYGHLHKITCRRGQQVSAGQKIGEVGSTGRSTGPHLHFEIRPGNNPEDPLKFLRGSSSPPKPYGTKGGKFI